jgi:hypothetical protein
MNEVARHASLSKITRFKAIEQLAERKKKERAEMIRKAIASVTPKKDVQELEVVEAWGGPLALSMLQKYTPKQVNSVSWVPRNPIRAQKMSKETAARFRADGHYDRVTRDYTKAVFNVSNLTKKRSEYLITEKSPRKPVVNLVSKDAPKRNITKKAEKSKSPAKVRRLVERAAKFGNPRVEPRGTAVVTAAEAAKLLLTNIDSLKGEELGKILQDLGAVLKDRLKLLDLSKGKYSTVKPLINSLQKDSYGKFYTAWNERSTGVKP